MLEELLALHSAFTQSSMTAILLELGKAKGTEFVKLEELDDFGETVAKRVRCMLRHYTQALAKSKPPAWALGEHRSVGDAADSWLIGWSAEFNQAWRASNEKSPKEYSEKLFVHDEHQDPLDAVWASWPDEFEHEIPEITVLMYQEIKKAKASAKRG